VNRALISRLFSLSLLVAPVLLLVAPVLLTGCSKTQSYAVMGTAEAAGADAVLKVTPAEGSNYQLTLTVTNLLPPDRVTPGATTFAVWLRLGERAPLQVGNLAYDADDRAGKLTTMTPYKDFELTVRAEKTNSPVAPSDAIVLKQQVAMKH
jgi:hypothetical protein